MPKPDRSNPEQFRHLLLNEQPLLHSDPEVEFAGKEIVASFNNRLQTEQNANPHSWMLRVVGARMRDTFSLASQRPDNPQPIVNRLNTLYAVWSELTEPQRQYIRENFQSGYLEEWKKRAQGNPQTKVTDEHVSELGEYFSVFDQFWQEHQQR